MAPLCTLGVGGAAQHFAVAETVDDVREAVRWAQDEGLELRVLGGGSNLVIADEGVPGLVLQMAIRGIDRRLEGGQATYVVGAGEPWDDFVAASVADGDQGLECLSGIPGSVGATPIQNVGAYGQEVAETIASVRVLDRRSGELLELAAEACAFGYRDSLFKSREPGRYIVLEVRFRLRRGAPAKLAYGELRQHFGITDTTQRWPSLTDVREAVLRLRRAKSMVLESGDLNRRSCGSFFVNALVTTADVKRITRVAGRAPPTFPQPDGRVKVPSAWLIEQAGLTRGTRLGRAGLSTRHTLAIVAHDGATARDVLALAHHVRRTVRARFGVLLVPEPDFWGFGAFDERLPELAS